MKFFVYWNLHKKCWSLKAMDGPDKGKVTRHAKSLVLDDCVFKVSEAGRQRVIKEKRKNVHAGVVGTIDMVFLDCASSPVGDGFGIRKRVTYNPYKHASFVDADDPSIPVHKAASVVMCDDKSVWAYDRSFL